MHRGNNAGRSSVRRSRPFSSGSFKKRSPSRNRDGGGFRSRNSGQRGGRGGSSRGGGGRGGRARSSFDVNQYINRQPLETQAEAPYQAKHVFTDFAINQTLKKNIANLGLTHPTPIQDQIIPSILEGKDVVGLAATGTGKTAAFLIPVIERIMKTPGKQVLVLTPTRELAIQIEREFRGLIPGLQLSAATCVGGMNIRPQLQSLRRRPTFIIGTPGRVIDLIERGSIRPERISTVVLDEADRMLDMGFIHDMKRILQDVPKDNRHTLFFSATMSDTVSALVKDFLIDPMTVSVRTKDITGTIKQDVVRYTHTEKFSTLVNLLKKPEFSRVIVFGAMKHSVEKLSKELLNAGIKADAIHGNKSHGQRQRALSRFKSGDVKVLVATDVAARGIHVDDVSHVINYDLPGTYEDYVHRIGRTGRANKLGQALTFVPA